MMMARGLRQKKREVFRPFFRLDESRNMDTGGVGLGHDYRA